MGFFDNEKNVQEYMEMAEGYDGTELINILKEHLPSGKTVLEIGMGPGKDLDILKKYYDVTGSDNSRVFINRYRKSNPDARVLLLDAVDLKTDLKFDCLYSNKVLHHLTREDLKISFNKQKDLLNEGGLLAHSFWAGDREEVMEGLLFIYYTEKELEKMIGKNYEIVRMIKYKEFEDKDSIYLILRKK